MMELEVFDLALNNVGLIDVYTELRFEINYEKHSELSLVVDASKENIALLKEDMILTKHNDLERGYIIKHVEFLDDKSSRLLIDVYSLSVLLNDRFIIGQQSHKGNIEDVMKAFVNNNAVNPKNPNRIIPNLIIGENTGIDIDVEETALDEPLDEYLYELAKKHDISWDVLLNHENKKYVFTVWQGVDRTTEQTVNNHVMFSKELDNVITQEYVTDNLHHKTTAIVAGEGEDVDRARLTVNDELSGYDRKEIFVDARDLQRKYKDENDREINLSPTEYENVLKERGENKLVEYKAIRTFESEIDMYSQFMYGVDYFCGDKVTIENEDVGIVMHTRVMSAIELYSRNGDDLKLDFGSSIPTTIDRIKRMVK